MRSLVAKIFVCSVLAQCLAHAAWVTFGILLAGTHPGPGRLLAHTLPLYADLAATTLERDGPAALVAFLARGEQESGLKLTLRTGGDCAPGRSPGPVLAVPVTRPATQYCLMADTDADAPRRHAWRWADAMLPLELVLSGVFSFFLARYLLLPIRKISYAAQALAGGDLTARAGARLGRRRDEAGELVRQFDRMADQIALLIEAQQRFIGDVSHEIKSPLARLSMALGLARREAGLVAASRFDRMEREIETISQLIRELLTLASLNAGSPLKAAPVDLIALVRGIIEDAAFERPDHLIRFVCGEAPLYVDGDPVLLRRAVENVLRNALFYAYGGTPVDVAIDRMAEGGVRITIRDEGPGVPPEALAHLFDPFYRVDEARARNTGGIGIGLAICTRAIGLHGGRVLAENTTPSGLAVTMELPGDIVRLDSGVRPGARARLPLVADKA
jgi:signal transduction histidine kinase